MKIEKQQTETYVLTDITSLDPITIYINNICKGKGKITIECYGRAWTNYWGGMGDQSIQEFFCGANNDYILGKFLSKTDETDFDEISRQSNGAINATSGIELAMMQSEMIEHFGGDWYMDLPTCKTAEYKYLSRIIDAVKEAFQIELLNS